MRSGYWDDLCAKADAEIKRLRVAALEASRDKGYCVLCGADGWGDFHTEECPLDQ